MVMTCENDHHLQLLNPLQAELNPVCHLLTLLGTHHILHISRIRVNVGRWSVRWPSAKLLMLGQCCVSNTGENNCCTMVGPRTEI